MFTLKVIRLIPIRVVRVGELRSTGLIDVTYEYRAGFLWLKKVTRTRRLASTGGVLWNWADSPNSHQFTLTEMVNQYAPELASGQTIEVAHQAGYTCSLS